MEYNKRLLAISLTVLCVLMILVSFQLLTKPKIAYIKSNIVIEGFIGMKEAQKKFEQKSQTWKSNIDTLEISYQQALNKFNERFSKLGAKEKADEATALRMQKDNLEKYVQAVNEKAKAEDEKVTQAVLNQVNSFIEEYGKKHNYTLILGTTSSGNILYGEESIDISKELLEALNNSYKGL